MEDEQSNLDSENMFLLKAFLGSQKTAGLQVIFRTYGLVSFPFQIVDFEPSLRNQVDVIFVNNDLDLSSVGISIQLRSHKELFYSTRATRKTLFFSHKTQVEYYALLPHFVFEGENIEPIWFNDEGQSVIAFLNYCNQRILLIGLDVEEEIVRYRQGDPSKVITNSKQEVFGFSHERPNYLFEDQIHAQYPTYPWADKLGFFLAEMFSRLTGYPLLEVFPEGAKGLVILTGDDDQAFLETYEIQLNLLRDFPITYFLHYLTKHTKETIRMLPSTVEFGLHPDALVEPLRYKELCVEQSIKIKELVGQSLHLVRNHGFLNDGYLGHLPVWQEIGLELDVNYPGVEGIALNGSFLAYPVRSDGLYRSHYSLLTLFGDGMIEPYGANLSIRAAVARINQLANQIEQSYPGIMVFNFHPQNIAKTKKLHNAVLKIAKRPGWVAIGLGTFLQRLKTIEDLQIVQTGEFNYLLEIPQPLEGLVLRYPSEGSSWKRKKLPSWCGVIEVKLS